MKQTFLDLLHFYKADLFEHAALWGLAPLTRLTLLWEFTPPLGLAPVCGLTPLWGLTALLGLAALWGLTPLFYLCMYMNCRRMIQGFVFISLSYFTALSLPLF